MLKHIVVVMKLTHTSTNLKLVRLSLARPVESHSGAQETILGGPSTTSFRMRRDRGNMGEGCPLTIGLGIWGSVVTS